VVEAPKGYLDRFYSQLKEKSIQMNKSPDRKTKEKNYNISELVKNKRLRIKKSNTTSYNPKHINKI
jgi:hypothetical protein